MIISAATHPRGRLTGVSTTQSQRTTPAGLRSQIPSLHTAEMGGNAAGGVTPLCAVLQQQPAWLS